MAVTQLCDSLRLDKQVGIPLQSLGLPHVESGRSQSPCCFFTSEETSFPKSELIHKDRVRAFATLAI